MSELLWHCGRRRRSKIALCAMLAVLLLIAGDGQACFARPRRPPGKSSSKAPQARHSRAPRAAVRAGGRGAVKQSKRKAGSRQPAAGFHPKYSVSSPVQQEPVSQAPVREGAVPEPGVPQESVPASPPADEAVLGEPGGKPILYPHALDAFFRVLAARRSPGSDTAGSSTVRILQFGDSHTAADIFTGEMRAQLQAKFGDGGLGFQYPGHPFPGYRLLGSTRSETSGWVTQGNRFSQLGDGDTGLGGIAISTNRPGESVFLTTTCETLQVQYLRQPGGGALDFSDNGQPVSEIKTATDASDATRAAGTFTYACSPGVHEFQLITMESAPVRLLGMVTEQAGVTYECLGINGAVAPLMLRWNQQMFADYLGQRNPSLIVLAYGTNEASESAARNSQYVADLHELLTNLHRIVPDASILVLGPYDRALRAGRGRRAQWRTSTAIDRIIADQREACRVDNCAFYDQRARMGGAGVMSHLVATGLAQVDHTHLTGTGYRVLADALYRDLMGVYNTYLLSAGNSGRTD
jgi:lysophospholipase L1-like esterase